MAKVGQAVEYAMPKTVYGDTSETVIWLAFGQSEDVVTLPE